MKKALNLALFGIILGGAAAHAQDFDDRFYISPRVGAVFADNDRETDDALFTGLSFGRFVSPNVAVDLEFGHNDFDLDNFDKEWENISVGVAARYFFSEGSFRPYLMGGLGAIRHDRWNAPRGWNPMLNVGGGFQYGFSEDVFVRGELSYRHDFDNESINGRNPLAPGASLDNPDEPSFGDFLATVGLVVMLGDRPAPPPPPPMDETIDLRGVNFDFDKCNLRPDAVTILGEAVRVLTSRNIRVEVAGHTDSVGSDAYNQKLSECRAQVVADYLTGNGVSGGAITAVVGYGESRPIDTNETSEGRARNRRTELVVRN